MSTLKRARTHKDPSRLLEPAASEGSRDAFLSPDEFSESRNEVTGQDKGLSRLRLTGADLRQMLGMGATLLEENVEAVNALNVFPVPDGDTGTNMLLTMQAAMEEVAKVQGADFGSAAHAAAHGALMGARGNSGVILSQILRGIARATDGKESIDAAELAAALKEGANTAYRGIGKPVEGTILTVARESADAAVAASPGPESGSGAETGRERGADFPGGNPDAVVHPQGCRRGRCRWSGLPACSRGCTAVPHG